MKQEFPPQPGLLDRRALIKSALLASAFTMGVPAGLSQAKSPASSSATSERSAEPVNGPLRRGMIGFQLAFEQFTINELVELGIAAEKAGFDVITASDHLQPWQANEGHAGQSWIAFGAIGQRTKRIWMGTTVTCPSFRYNPAVVAEGFASLSLLYPGRIFLGIGSGEALNEQAAIGSWPKWPERSERLVEASDVIRQVWTGKPLDHKGKYYQVTMRLYDPPQQPIPLLMAGNGPKAMHRCGMHGDGLITDPKTWKNHKDKFAAGAKEAGKDPGRMPVFVEQFVVVGDQSQAQQAAELWRFLPKAWNPYFNDPSPENIQQRADKEVPLREVMKEMTVSADPEAHVNAILEQFHSGVTEVHVHSGQADQMRAIDFYGKEVLPRLRKQLTSSAA
jgi:TAT-translocated FGD2 family F420-dependent dehydrogenase